MELDGEPLTQQVENSVEEKPGKKKKAPRITKTGEVDKRAVRSEAQKAHAAKMVSIMKAKRAAQKQQQEEEASIIAEANSKLDEQQKEMKRIIEYEMAKKKRAQKPPPIPQYVTTPMLDLAVRKILAAMPPYQVERVPYKDIPKPEVIERVHPVERVVVKEVAVPKQLSGNALLDSIFFK